MIQDIQKQGNKEGNDIENKPELGMLSIKSRRYLGNKYSLTDFIRKTVDDNCQGINIVVDIFSGTGSVANAFRDKILFTNDLLYINYLSNVAWFGSEDFSKEKIEELLRYYNRIKTSEDNYMRQNFADTFFSADDCSKIGFIREDIEQRYASEELNFREYAMLITSLIYAMDRIANTVGHYDAFRRNGNFEKSLVLDMIEPSEHLNPSNRCYNRDANELIKELRGDLLYLDPPYNSRQYGDAYHLLENVARWEKPEVKGVARKMDRTGIKSKYCTVSAEETFRELIENANFKYILLSYNNMAQKGNDRSNAKISDGAIMEILERKGKVTVFEQDYKSFSTGKTKTTGNKERLFLCEVTSEKSTKEEPKHNIKCPFNYIGGKYKILNQIQPLMAEGEVFLDLFAGGGNVGINARAPKIILSDKNYQLMGLIKYIQSQDTDELVRNIKSVIVQYGLSDTATFGYDFYGLNSSEGLGKVNREGFLKLRDDFNEKIDKNEINYLLLYVLILYSFNNQIRFNRNGYFNLPVGKRDFNAKMQEKLIAFSEELKQKDVEVWAKDFRDISLTQLPADTFIYCDPPYLITDATYNENGQWTEDDEGDLLEYLNKANSQGYKFALSNVIFSKNKINLFLQDWIRNGNYYSYYIVKNYSNSNYQRKDKDSLSQEVLVTNYPI